MKRIALTGGIACGKSLVAQYLNEFGVETIDADDLAHELIPDPAERKRIAAEVFSDPEKRRALEARLHPCIQAKIDAFLASSSPALKIAIIPLLFESHWNEKYDIICTVQSPRETQVERMMTTRGYTREEALARIAAQLPVSEKAQRSHYVINNTGSKESLKEEVRKLVEKLKGSYGR